jgi:hypothetical protein
MANYGWQVEGPLIPLPFDVSVEGGRGAAPGISCAAPLAAVPKAGWGEGRLPSRYLGHFNKEPINGRGAVA